MIQYNIHESKNSESIKNISWTFIVDEILRRSFFSSFINKCNVHDFVKFLLFLLMIQYTYTILNKNFLKFSFHSMILFQVFVALSLYYLLLTMHMILLNFYFSINDTNFYFSYIATNDTYTILISEIKKFKSIKKIFLNFHC